MVDDGADDAGGNAEDNPSRQFPVYSVQKALQLWPYQIFRSITAGEKPEGSDKDESAKKLPEDVWERKFVENALHPDSVRF